ncbi:TadE/TadG family type IV pilus assembly protein [Hephaestia sp. GCM10023244]|uniref:TadE/TadG family type IV pilus assembly protein n=1 Tax=unclassified Hephaestia TaxID=2631281 RepID=UPI0020776D51|nr:TadE/TadG family type IV pilus assembly protein [Hephaestia sp. MAHUQ-44]MCM8730010.1 pilus assembly protein [Hephaestia sp. MAHUQ-44]
MIRNPRLLRTLGQTLPRDVSGVALIEFAIGLPFILLIACTGMETANYVLAHLRVSQIALTTADNAARVRIQVDESDVNQMFAGDREIGSAIGFANQGRVILSSLSPNPAATGQWINWQRCFGALNVASRYGAEGKGKNDASLPAMGTGAHRIAAAPGTAVMFVEVNYRYRSLFPGSPIAGKIIHFESAMNVRERTNQTISNNAASVRATC